MRGSRVLTGAAATAIAVAGSLSMAPGAHAKEYGIELNGTYRATSDGEWAKTNDVFRDERTVIQTWTIATSCASPLSCTGTVTSDQGWAAPIDFKSDFWNVQRVIENWEPCPAFYDYPGARIFTGAEGTAAPGTQSFSFYGRSIGNSGNDANNTDLLAGRERTQAPSGACGINKPLIIELPFRLERVS
jgi:hypothetical protein